MNYIKYHQTLIHKTLLLTGIFGILGWGVFVFSRNQSFLESIKISYIKDIYLPALTHATSNVTKNVNKNLGFVLGALPTTNEGVASTTAMVGPAPKSIPILLYHGIIENDKSAGEGDSDGLNVSVKTFADQMKALKNAGYTAVSFDTFEQIMRGDIVFNGKPILITFDDGRKDSYYTVDPLLKIYGFSATMFILPKYSLLRDKDSDYYLSKAELEKMSKNGRWTIESHSLDAHTYYPTDAEGKLGYYYSNKLWIPSENRVESDEEFRTRVTHDLSESKNAIESELNINVDAIAYPFSEYGQHSNNYTKAVYSVPELTKGVYTYAFYQVNPASGGSVQEIGKDQFLLKRIEPKPEWSGFDLIAMLHAASEKTLPFNDTFVDYKGWIKSWGSYSYNADNLELETTEYTRSGMTFLDGTQYLDDYLFTANARFSEDITFSLVARYTDNQNYATCNFDNNQVVIEQRIGGTNYTLIKQKNTIDLSQGPVSLSIVANGTTIKCYVGQEPIVSTNALDPILRRGGVGLEVWNKNPTSSSIGVSEVNIVSISDAKEFIATLPEYDSRPQVTPIKKPVVVKPILPPQQLIPFAPTTTPSQEQPAPPVVEETSPIIPISLFGSDQTNTPYYADTTALHGWKNMFGEASTRDTMLQFSTNASTASSMAVLEGSENWRDYIYSMKFDWYKGTSVTLVARYTDPKNYTACSFGTDGKSVRLYQLVDGVTKTIGQSPQLPMRSYATWKDIAVSMSVNRNHVECLKDGVWALRADLSDIPLAGGIGIKTYESRKGEAAIGVKEITVEGI